MEYKTLIFLILCPWEVFWKYNFLQKDTQIQLHLPSLFYLPSSKSDQAVFRVKPSLPRVTFFSLYTKINLSSGICLLQVSCVQMDFIFHNFRKNRQKSPKKSAGENICPLAWHPCYVSVLGRNRFGFHPNPILYHQTRPLQSWWHAWPKHIPAA